MRGDFDFGVLIKPTHPGGHPNIWILALSPKLWVWQSLLSFKPENSDFDHLDKIGPSCKGMKDENKTCHGPSWYWVKVIHKQRKIWNRKFFKSKIEEQHLRSNSYQRSFSDKNVHFKCLQKNKDNSTNDCFWIWITNKYLRFLKSKHLHFTVS